MIEPDLAVTVTVYVPGARVLLAVIFRAVVVEPPALSLSLLEPNVRLNPLTELAER